MSVKKVVLIIVVTIVAFKVLDRLFLNKHVWSKLPGEGYEDYYEDEE